MMDLVQWSIQKANEEYSNTPIRLNDHCQYCGEDMWYREWGIDSRYASRWNPGEYITFTCSRCGYSYEEQC